MTMLVVFDTTYGNTKIIADTIASRLGNDAMAVPVDRVHSSDFDGVDLLVVGSPIIAWRPSQKIQAFLTTLHEASLTGVRAAAFDTRVRLFIHGDAASKISHALEKAGAQIVAEPRGFIVTGREGPLAEGEVDEAASWADTFMRNAAEAES
jgi:flavodoxin